MSVTFRCENCGQWVLLEASSSKTAICPNCHKAATIPAALASLPHPHVPANSGHLPVGLPAVRPAPAHRSAARREIAPEPTLGLTARLMPVVISLFFHLGVVMACMFVSLAVARRETSPQAVISATKDPLSHDLSRSSYSVSPNGPRNPKRVSGETIAKTGRTELALVGPLASGRIQPRPGLVGPGYGNSGDAAGRSFGSGRSASVGVMFICTRTGVAHHVCFVIDGSGSMIDSFPEVRDKILDAIVKLGVVQDFDVIIINGAPGQYLENPPQVLVPASSRNKEDVAFFLDGIQASSRGVGGGKAQAGGIETEAAPALARAFDVLDKASSLPGKVLFLLTDGVFADAEKAAAVVSSRNKKKEVRIHTFLYGHEQDSAKVFMEKLAKDNGGEYKYVSEGE